ncbi:hypothetical protein VOLCADRAFT_104607 [Volvox carteri f. nagariensis]|uniref:Uncharacterized protein n=1 Tax=Volvox carteri f. nagariensis TaxID=3068 RepID=D8TUU3_VOLCA|nr:uncharacterized protein VOLCADRAFT_104607 [Volvox carteri f. nagariensis]EFJ48770.1 hypothetical protein VOLCADRAFT_104607 [Volvox carteri f. nagariensis]|eukprot:XP_002950102.1 hypothetical protein VOLCADRAFT_104607 [Volvox carteri f. nagariensis]
MMSLTLKPASASVARRTVRSEVVSQPARSRRHLCTRALLGPDGKPGADGAKKKFITREEEPEQYWSSKGEQDGANPLKDPLAIIGILAIFFPFIFLAVAVAAGYIDLSVYR